MTTHFSSSASRTLYRGEMTPVLFNLVVPPVSFAGDQREKELERASPAVQLHHNLARAVVVDLLKLANETCDAVACQ